MEGKGKEGKVEREREREKEMCNRFELKFSYNFS
jgi:hypothetical protein